MTARESVRVSAFLLASIFWPAGCDQNVSATGTVRDPSGVPLESVSVTMETTGRAPDIANTAKDGAFNVGIIGADPRATRISFQKPGYKRIQQPLGPDPRPVLQITLVPEATSP
jgi:hypothetical protein